MHLRSAWWMGYISSDVFRGLKLLCIPHRDVHVARLHNLVKAWQTNVKLARNAAGLHPQELSTLEGPSAA